jgi:uncharacterized protein
MRPVLSLIALLSALAAVSPASAAERSDNGADRWIEVSGEGAVSAAPDFARVTLGVTTMGKTAGEATEANAKAASALIAVIKAEGVAPADIQTSSLSVSPLFAHQPREEAGPPAIEGYSVGNNVTVTVRDIPRLGSLIDKAASAGANSIYGVGFGHNDLSALLDKARPLAVADARRKAEIYANAAGAKIGPLIRLTEEPGSPRPIAFARAYVAGGAPTPIEAGEDKLTVTVSARFELTQ